MINHYNNDYFQFKKQWIFNYYTNLNKHFHYVVLNGINDYLVDTTFKNEIDKTNLQHFLAQCLNIFATLPLNTNEIYHYYTIDIEDDYTNTSHSLVLLNHLANLVLHNNYTSCDSLVAYRIKQAINLHKTLSLKVISINTTTLNATIKTYALTFNSHYVLDKSNDIEVDLRLLSKLMLKNKEWANFRTKKTYGWRFCALSLNTKNQIVLSIDLYKDFFYHLSKDIIHYLKNSSFLVSCKLNLLPCDFDKSDDNMRLNFILNDNKLLVNTSTILALNDFLSIWYKLNKLIVYLITHHLDKTIKLDANNLKRINNAIKKIDITYNKEEQAKDNTYFNLTSLNEYFKTCLSTSSLLAS